ncbi:MAG: FAD-dependent oxidoreductase [Candidatus Krumholzibacteria bacterium]|nr:FAD-dependent oxidoreductase [Candidatus Krumholzibacteria bacterium]
MLTVSGMQIECDFVCIGVGIAPAVQFARRAGLDIENGIVVDEHLRTSHPDIYAGGDVVNYPDPVFKKRRRVEHWGHAEYCGQVAGLNMAGTPQKYDLLTYVWSDVFDLHIECAGDETARDRTLLRGSLGEPSLSSSICVTTR